MLLYGLVIRALLGTEMTMINLHLYQQYSYFVTYFPATISH